MAAATEAIPAGDRVERALDRPEGEADAALDLADDRVRRERHQQEA